MSSNVPSKSQPLHNFTLPPLLRWKKDGKSGGNHKRSRLMKSPMQQRANAASASPPRYSPLRDYITQTSSPPSQEYPEPPPPPPDSPIIGGDSVEEATVCEGMKQLAVGGGDSEKLSSLKEEALRYSRGGDWEPESEASRKGKGAVIEQHRNQFKKSAFGHLTKGVCSSNSEEGKFARKCQATEGGVAGIKKKSNVSIKIAGKNNKEEEEKIEINGEHGGIDEEEKEGKTNNNLDEEVKLWNLRPRNVKSKLEKAKAGGEKGDVSGKNKAAPAPPLKSCANKSSGKGGGEKKEKCGKVEEKEKGEKREKKKLSISISLTKEEIEEDIFALTGSKPSRRPKRRPKNVQKDLDLMFPGLWLLAITPETYKVSESSLKG